MSDFEKRSQRAGRFLRDWSDAWFFVPLSIVFFVLVGWAIAAAYPEAGFFPVSVLHKLNYAATGTFACLFTATIWLRFHFPNVLEYLRKYFEYDLLNQTDIKSNEIKYQLKCDRFKYSLLVFCLPVLVFLAVLMSV